MDRLSSLTLDRRAFVLGSALAAGAFVSPLGARTTTIAERRVLWAANVRTKPFLERIAAAQEGGFTHMSVFPIDYRMWVEQGLKPAEMRRALRQSGVKVLAIDPFVQWVPGFEIPSAYPAENRGFIDFDEEQIFRIADELEAEALNCVEGLGQPHERARLVDAFGKVADRAAARGLRVTLEFMPISSIPDLASGWPIVAGVDRANAGLCFDTWHHYRSTPDDALLATIPGSKIFEVQLADALTERRGKDLVEDLLRYRMLPGEGELPIASAVANLRAIGALHSVGPEVFADAMDAIDSVRVGRLAAAATQRLIGSAGFRKT
ncbi:MAG TPA: sugar phosphate isomerase/epimerase [Allosphingosinicella sp.]|nr:sugar phosphate isomerase/epimerase [Allosphingosinicella sp.]